MPVRPEYYREQARRSRELAKRAVDLEITQHLRSVAEQYDRLAKEAEAKGH